MLVIGWKEKRHLNAVVSSNDVWNGIKRYDSKTIWKWYENAVLDKKISGATVYFLKENQMQLKLLINFKLRRTGTQNRITSDWETCTHPPYKRPCAIHSLSSATRHMHHLKSGTGAENMWRKPMPPAATIVYRGACSVRTMYGNTKTIYMHTYKYYNMKLYDK